MSRDDSVRRKRCRAGSAVVAALVTLMSAACGDDDTATSTASTSVDQTSAPSEAPAAPSVVVATTSLGDVLVDEDGATLYLFTPDGGDTPTCDDACAEVWPPVTVDGSPVAGDGADPGLVGTVERSDGSVQLTYAGHPLYRYSQDEAAGDVKGQGVNDVWFAVGPDGSAIEPTADVDYGY